MRRYSPPIIALGAPEQDTQMRFLALTLIGLAAGIASIDTADAARNCGPGMNSDGYRGCVPIRGQGYRGANRYRGAYGYHRQGYDRGPQGPRNCGPGMNSDGYRGCVPQGGGGGYYRPGY